MSLLHAFRGSDDGRWRAPSAGAMAAILIALALSACGGSVKPAAPAGSSGLAGRGRIDDPRTAKANHVKCLKQDDLPVQEMGNTTIQIGPLPAGPTVVFTPTPGAAQTGQIEGTEQGAEVIGSALLYPNQGSDAELQKIENCLDQGVSG